MKERKHRFVVGYPSDQGCVYGKSGYWEWTRPFTLYQAKTCLRTMADPGAIIYELKPRLDLGQSDGNGKIVDADVV